MYLGKGAVITALGACAFLTPGCDGNFIEVNNNTTSTTTYTQQKETQPKVESPKSTQSTNQQTPGPHRQVVDPRTAPDYPGQPQKIIPYQRNYWPWQNYNQNNNYPYNYNQNYQSGSGPHRALQH
jgi:hypothetical protein